MGRSSCAIMERSHGCRRDQDGHDDCYALSDIEDAVRAGSDGWAQLIGYAIGGMAQLAVAPYATLEHMRAVVTRAIYLYEECVLD